MVLRDLRVMALHLLIIEVVNKNDSGLLLHIIRWIVWNGILMQVIKHDFVIIRSPVRRIVATPFDYVVIRSAIISTDTVAASSLLLRHALLLARLARCQRVVVSTALFRARLIPFRRQ